MKNLSSAVSLAAAFALGAGAYARYGAEDGPRARVETTHDDPEFLREDSSTNGASTSRPVDTPSPEYKSTYDPDKGGVAQSTSTSTSTNMNRSTARPAEPEL